MDPRRSNVGSSKKSKSRREASMPMQTQSQPQPQTSVYRPQPPTPIFQSPLYQPQMFQYQHQPQIFQYSSEDQQAFNPFGDRPIMPSPRIVDNRPLPVYNDEDDDEDVPETQVDEEEDDEEDEPEIEPTVRKFNSRTAKQSWTSDQEIALCKAWVHISEDKRVGNQQRKNGFWTRILKHYNELVGESNRTVHQLNSKWMALNGQMTEFNGFYIQAERLRSSGCDDVQVLSRALADYQKKHPSGFSHIDAWNIVRKHDKWGKVPLRDETSSEHSDKRRKSSEAGNYQSCTPDDAKTSHLPDLNEETAPTRPNRKQKKQTTESSSYILFDKYTSMKEERLKDLVEIKKRQGEEAIALLEEQRANVREERYDRDLKTFCEPHNHLSGHMLELVLARKREIAAKHNWPCDF